MLSLHRRYCGGSASQDSPASPTAAASPAATAPVVAATPNAVPTEPVIEPFDRTTFTNSSIITNPWLPFTPGTHWVWEGAANVDGERIARRVELTITDLTKMIGGVRTAVAYELDYNEDLLIEAELIFFAQDQRGNVWHLGQYPEEYDEGVFVDAPAWIHGYQGASAGIFMQAAPQLGAPSYSQGWGPPSTGPTAGRYRRWACAPVSGSAAMTMCWWSASSPAPSRMPSSEVLRAGRRKHWRRLGRCRRAGAGGANAGQQ